MDVEYKYIPTANVCWGSKNVDSKVEDHTQNLEEKPKSLPKRNSHGLFQETIKRENTARNDDYNQWNPSSKFELPPSPTNIENLEELSGLSSDIEYLTKEYLDSDTNESCGPFASSASIYVPPVESRFQPIINEASRSSSTLSSTENDNTSFGSNEGASSLDGDFHSTSSEETSKKDEAKRRKNEYANLRRKELSEHLTKLNELLPYAICEHTRTPHDVTLRKALEYIKTLEGEIKSASEKLNKTGGHETNYSNDHQVEESAFEHFCSSQKQTFLNLFQTTPDGEIIKMLRDTWNTMPQDSKKFFYPS